MYETLYVERGWCGAPLMASFRPVLGEKRRGCNLILPISAGSRGWSPLARSDRRWCGFREVGVIFSRVDQDAECHGDVDWQASSVERLGPRAGEYTFSSGGEDPWGPSTARIQGIEESACRDVWKLSGTGKRDQPVRSEMRVRTETDDSRRVREALTSISGEQRTALELAYWDGLSPTEIGKRTDSSPESVHQRLKLALLKLGALLSKS